MWIASGLCAFAAAVLISAIIVRLPGLARPVPIFVLIGGIIGFLFTGYSLWRYGPDATVISSALVYAFFCELYLFLFTLAGNSVSLRLLTEVSTRKLRAADIAAYYQADAMVERRFAQLRTAGLVGGDAGAMILTRQGQLLVGAFKALRAMFGMTARVQESAIDR